MINLWAIAKITFLEGLRSRLFFALFLIGLLLFSSTYTLSYLFPRDIVKVAVDLNLGIASLVGLILTLFLGSQLIAKDLEKRTIHMVLAKAVSRFEYIVGKLWGLSLIIVVTMALLGAFASTASWTVDHLIPHQYGNVHWPEFGLALGMMVVKLILLASVIVFFSSFTSSTFLALGLTLIVYVIGQSVEELKQFLTSGSEGIAIDPTFLKVVSAAYYVFPNLAAFDFKSQAAHGFAIPMATIGWSVLYGAVYTGVMTLSAAWIFGRREFP